MSGTNEDRKLTYEDHFGRRYYCKHAKRNQVLAMKKFNRRAARRKMNRESNGGEDSR
jgi:hypothetical protein